MCLYTKYLLVQIEDWKKKCRNQQKVRGCEKEVTKISIKPETSGEARYHSHSSKHTAKQVVSHSRHHHNHEANEKFCSFPSSSGNSRKAQISKLVDDIFDMMDSDEDDDD